MSSFGSRSLMSNVSYQKTKPTSTLPSLFRYEVFVLSVWFFVEMGRWYAKDKAFRKLQREEAGEEEDTKIRRLPIHRTMAYGVLIGALIGALVFWLITDVFFYDAFHSDVGVRAISVSAPFSLSSNSFTKRPPKIHDL